MKKNSGFTLIELMITLAIVAILLTVGVPSLTTFMQGNRLIAASNELITDLHVARSEAIKLNKRVTICESINGTSCTNPGTGDWRKGWIVFVDANDDRVGTGVSCSANTDTDCLLRVHDVIDEQSLSVSGKYDSTATPINWFTFSARGLPKSAGAAQSGIFSVCSFDSSDAVINSRAVVLSLSGRVRVSDNTAVVSCPAAP